MSEASQIAHDTLVRLNTTLSLVTHKNDTFGMVVEGTVNLTDRYAPVETIREGTYGIIRYFEEGKYGVMWLREAGAICIEVPPKRFALVTVFP